MPEPCPSQAWDSQGSFHLFFSPEMLPRQPAAAPAHSHKPPLARDTEHLLLTPEFH